MSKTVPLTPGTTAAIEKSILSPNLERLEHVMKGRQANTDLVKVANHMMDEGLWSRESPERLEARQKIHNFLVKKLPLKSKVKRVLRFQGAGKRKTLRNHKDNRRGRKGRSTRKQTIPPAVVEALELVVEAGGARRTRKNVKRR
jgi:hypothetical protein